MLAKPLVAALVAVLLAAPTPPKPTDAELGKPFRLRKGELARLVQGRVTLRITGFIKSPCPKGAQCMWSGLSVLYELTVDGKVQPRGQDSLYDVTVREGDYRSFAVFVVKERAPKPAGP